MRILFYRHSLLSRGGDKMVLLHATALAVAGHEVTISSRVVDTVFPVPPQINIISGNSTGKGWTLWKATRRFLEYDAILADIIPLACLLSLRNRRRVIYFAQDYDESYYSSTTQKLFIRFLYFIGLSILKLPAIVVSEPLAVLFLKRFGAKTVVVRNGVDEGVFFPDPDSELVKDKRGRLSVLVLSRSDKRKGFDLLCDVFNRTQTLTSVNFEIWSVGEVCAGVFDGFEHHDFGYVSEEKLRHVMSSADVFLYPSRHEGFPLMVLEALSCNSAVVTTEAVSFVENGEEAMVSPVEDCHSLSQNLAKVLTDESLRNSLSRRGNILAKNSSLKKSSQNFCDAIHTILSSK